jgi:hypothetical protein
MLLRTLPLLAALLLATPAQASWALIHVAKTWAGDMTTLEVEQLSVDLEEADPKTTAGYWTLLLLGINADAMGDRELTCSLVDRIYTVARAKKDPRARTLKAGCLLDAGELQIAAKLAAASAREATATEPVDFAGLLVRSQEIQATAAMKLWRQSPDDARLRAKAEKAVAAWEASARLHHDGMDLVEALAYAAAFTP